MQAVGDLPDAELCRSQKECRFNYKELIYIIDDRAFGKQPYHSGEIGGRDIERIGIERDVVMLDEIVRKKADEAYENIFPAFPATENASSSLWISSKKMAKRCSTMASLRRFPDSRYPRISSSRL